MKDGSTRRFNVRIFFSIDKINAQIEIVHFAAPLEKTFDIKLNNSKFCETLKNVLSLPIVDNLTYRERQVLQLLANGYSTEEISVELQISIITARNHINKVMDKFGVNSRLQAVLTGIKLDLL